MLMRFSNVRELSEGHIIEETRSWRFASFIALGIALSA